MPERVNSRCQSSVVPQSQFCAAQEKAPHAGATGLTCGTTHANTMFRPDNGSQPHPCHLR
jgi:hypothetical protein